MKKISLLILGALFLMSGNLFAQVVDDTESNEEFDQFYERPIVRKAKKPFAYPYVRAADVVWEHAVWRVIDFREKMNQVFYYPLDPQQSRTNMWTMIDKAATEGLIKIYKDDEFKEEIDDWAAQKASMGNRRTEEVPYYDLDGTEYMKDTVIVTAMANEDIKTLRLKERWFIDKQRSVRDVRIVGFSLVYYMQQGQDENAVTIPMTIGWVRFNDPEVRDLLANTEVYNPYNDAERRTYDDIFQKRHFTSYVVRETNTYGRQIGDYLTGMDALYESERVEELLFNMEQDMWEY